MNGETTQDLSPRLSETYRYVVRHIGSRRKSPADYMPEFGTECVDSWTGDVMSVHWALSAELSSLVAETQCAERNAPVVALTFASKLALWLARGRDAEINPGDLCEDVDRILEWHLGRLRGLNQEPLAQARMFYPAPEFNE
jgi:hypothetical protein